MVSRTRCGLVLAGALVLADLAHAQALPRRWDRDQWEHLAAGAAVALAVRGPWVTPAWRDRLWKRGAWQLALGVTFEAYQAHELQRFDPTDVALDLVADLAGWVVVEVGAAALRLVSHSSPP